VKDVSGAWETSLMSDVVGTPRSMEQYMIVHCGEGCAPSLHVNVEESKIVSCLHPTIQLLLQSSGQAGSDLPALY